MGSAMDQAMQDLADEVTEVEGVEASALLLINSLADQLKAAGTDPAKLTALHDRMKASAAALAAGVAANTPTPPVPPV